MECTGRPHHSIYTGEVPRPTRIGTVLDTCSGSKWFITLDLSNGYWQVEKDDQPKTAFCTTEDIFEFKVMPFRWCNAPATFQRLMDVILAGLQVSSVLGLYYHSWQDVSAASSHSSLSEYEAGLKVVKLSVPFYNPKCNIWATLYHRMALPRTQVK